MARIAGNHERAGGESSIVNYITECLTETIFISSRSRSMEKLKKPSVQLCPARRRRIINCKVILNILTLGLKDFDKAVPISASWSTNTTRKSFAKNDSTVAPPMPFAPPITSTILSLSPKVHVLILF